jgi:hypothetical protein
VVSILAKQKRNNKTVYKTKWIGGAITYEPFESFIFPDINMTFLKFSSLDDWKEGIVI